MKSFIESLPLDTIIIEGECIGADKQSRIFAEKRGIQVLRFPADWEKYGKGEGVIRNTQMLIEGKPDIVVAFHNDIENSKGTKNMIIQSLKIGLSVYLNPITIEKVEENRYFG